VLDLEQLEEGTEKGEEKHIKFKFQDKRLSAMPYSYKPIPEKVHADVIEALNGAYMWVHRDIGACQAFLHHLGLLKYPSATVNVVRQ
jgi:dsRNA-specific ribonuclease